MSSGSGSAGSTNNYNDGMAKQPESIWDRAHRELNDMREGLLKAREEAQTRGRQADHDINEIDTALARIMPPTPQAIPSMTGTPAAPSKW